MVYFKKLKTTTGYKVEKHSNIGSLLNTKYFKNKPDAEYFIRNMRAEHRNKDKNFNI